MINFLPLIRPSLPSDTLQLEELFLFTQQQTFILRSKDEFKMGDYVKSVAKDKVLVAEIENKIVGFIIYLFTPIFKIKELALPY